MKKVFIIIFTIAVFYSPTFLFADSDVKSVNTNVSEPDQQDKISPEKDFYSNENYGITFNEPKGWIKDFDKPDRYLVRYVKLGQQNKVSGVILLTIDDVSNEPEVKNALDFAKAVLNKQIHDFPGAEVVKSPEIIDVNGIDAAAIMYDAPLPAGNQETNTMTTMMVFIMQERNIITINVISQRDAWEGISSDLGSILDSIKIKGTISADDLIKKAYMYTNSYKNYNKAIEYLEQAKLLKPNDAKIFLNIGVNYLFLNELDKAKASFEKAINLDQNYSEAYSNLASVYKQLGDYESAINNYKKALALKPENGGLYTNLGSAYVYAKQYREAVAILEKGLVLKPQGISEDVHFASTYLNLGYAYLMLQNYLPAKENLSKAEELYKKLEDTKQLNYIKGLLNKIPEK